MAGPPYEDIAFRIVDKEWDYSAKRERGFKSTFDKVCPGHEEIRQEESYRRSREFCNCTSNSSE